MAWEGGLRGLLDYLVHKIIQTKNLLSIYRDAFLKKKKKKRFQLQALDWNGEGERSKNENVSKLGLSATL